MQNNTTLKLFGALILCLSTGKNLVAADRSPFAGLFGRAIGNVATVGAATGGAHFLLTQHGSGMREVAQDIANKAVIAGVQEGKRELAKPENQRAIAGAAQGVANRAADHFVSKMPSNGTFGSMACAGIGGYAGYRAVRAFEEEDYKKAVQLSAISAGSLAASSKCF